MARELKTNKFKNGLVKTKEVYGRSPGLDHLILDKSYSEKFDHIRKQMICVSHYKYGDAKTNFANGHVDAIASLERKLAAYKRTGNTELLCDVANYAMFEFMWPLHPHGHYAPTDNDPRTRPVGDPVGGA